MLALVLVALDSWIDNQSSALCAVCRVLCAGAACGSPHPRRLTSTRQLSAAAAGLVCPGHLLCGAQGRTVLTCAQQPMYCIWREELGECALQLPRSRRTAWTAVFVQRALGLRWAVGPLAGSGDERGKGCASTQHYSTSASEALAAHDMAPLA